MSNDAKTACPACGALTSGRFCSDCGAARSADRHCGSCGVVMAAGARFCSACGAAPNAGRTADRARVIVPYLIGGAALISILALVFVNSTAAPPASAALPPVADAGPGGGTPPDLSQMSARERFDRLFNRVMEASESGDQATVTQFSPMAITAYGMLDEVDADARYHAAMIHLNTGDAVGAAGLADTILAGNPNHLLGLVLRGAIARSAQDQSALKKAQTAFLAQYETEKAAGHQEYQDHSVILDRFLQEARTASPGQKAP